MDGKNFYFKVISIVLTIFVTLSGLPISAMAAQSDQQTQSALTTQTTISVQGALSTQNTQQPLPPASQTSPLPSVTQGFIPIQPTGSDIAPQAETSLTPLDVSIDLDKKPYYFTADADTQYSVTYDDTTQKNYLLNKQTSAKVEISNADIYYHTVNPKHLEVDGKVYLQVWHRMGPMYNQYKVYDTQAGTWQDITLNDYGLAAKDPVLLAGFTPWTNGLNRADSVYDNKIFAVSTDCSKVMIAENKAQGAVLKVVDVPHHAYAPSSPGYIAEMGGKFYYVYEGWTGDIDNPTAHQTMKVEVWPGTTEPDLPVGYTRAASNVNYAYKIMYVSSTNSKYIAVLKNLTTGQEYGVWGYDSIYGDVTSVDVSPDGRHVNYLWHGTNVYPNTETMVFKRLQDLGEVYGNYQGIPKVEADVTSLASRNVVYQGLYTAIINNQVTVDLKPLWPVTSPNGVYAVSHEGSYLVARYSDGRPVGQWSVDELPSVKLISYSVTNEGVFMVTDSFGETQLHYMPFNGIPQGHVYLHLANEPKSSSSVAFKGNGVADITSTDNVTREVDLKYFVTGMLPGYVRTASNSNYAYKTVYVSSTNSKYITVLMNLTTGQELGVWGYDSVYGDVQFVDVSPDNRHVNYLWHGTNVYPATDTMVFKRLQDLGAVYGNYQGIPKVEADVTSLASRSVVYQGLYTAIIGNQKTVDLKPLWPVVVPAGYTQSVNNPNFAYILPYSHVVVAGGGSQMVYEKGKVMDLITGQVIYEFIHMYGSSVSDKACEISPDGKYIVTSYSDFAGDTLVLYNIATKAQTTAANGVYDIKFSFTQDGKVLWDSAGAVSSNSTLRFYNEYSLGTKTNRELYVRLVTQGTSFKYDPATGLATLSGYKTPTDTLYVFDASQGLDKMRTLDYYYYYGNGFRLEQAPSQLLGYVTGNGNKILTLATPSLGWKASDGSWLSGPAVLLKNYSTIPVGQLVIPGLSQSINYQGDFAIVTVVDAGITKSFRVNLLTMKVVASALEEKANQILTKYVTVVNGVAKVDYYGIFNSVIIPIPVNTDLVALIALKLVTEYDKTPIALLNIRGYGNTSLDRGIYLLSMIADSTSESLDVMKGLTKSLKGLQASVNKINEKQALKAMIVKMETRVADFTEAKKILDAYVKYVPHPNSNRYGWYEIDYDSMKNALLALPLNRVGSVGAELMNYMRKHLTLDGDMSSIKTIKLAETIVDSGWKGKWITFLLINSLGKLKNYYWPEDGMNYGALVDLMQEMRKLMYPLGFIGW